MTTDSRSADLLAALLARFGEDPAGCVLLTDLDGTLAPIVSRPDEAVPLAGSVAALIRLADRCLVVGVVSGRPLGFLDGWFPPQVRLAGLYGLVQRVDGVASTHPEAHGWREVVARVVAGASAELDRSVLVESKELSLTLHFRNDARQSAAVEAFAARAAEETGLLQRSAKASIELHPPVAVDKGAIVSAWAEGAHTVVFCGDDVGDLSAFDAIAGLSGVLGIRLVVGGAELPESVAARADVLVRGPTELGDLLDQLASAAAS